MFVVWLRKSDGAESIGSCLGLGRFRVSAHCYQNDFRRPIETNGHIGSAKAGGNYKMTVSFHQMSISFLKLALPANYVLPAKEAGTQRNGHVNLAAMGVSAERQRNAVRDAAENIGLMGEQDDGRFIFNLAQGCVKIVARRVPRAGPTKPSS